MRDACERFAVNGDEFQCTELTTAVFFASHYHSNKKKKEKYMHHASVMIDLPSKEKRTTKRGTASPPSAALTDPNRKL